MLTSVSYSTQRSASLFTALRVLTINFSQNDVSHQFWIYIYSIRNMCAYVLLENRSNTNACAYVLLQNRSNTLSEALVLFFLFFLSQLKDTCNEVDSADREVQGTKNSQGSQSEARKRTSSQRSSKRKLSATAITEGHAQKNHYKEASALSNSSASCTGKQQPHIKVLCL